LSDGRVLERCHFSSFGRLQCAPAQAQTHVAALLLREPLVMAHATAVPQWGALKHPSCVVRSHSNPCKTQKLQVPLTKNRSKNEIRPAPHTARHAPLSSTSPSHRSKCTQFGTDQPIQNSNSGLRGSPRRATVVFAGRLHNCGLALKQSDSTGPAPNCKNRLYLCGNSPSPGVAGCSDF